MKNGNNNFKETLSLAAILFAITAVVVGALAMVNYFTKDIIKANEVKAFSESLKKVITAEKFEPYTSNTEGKLPLAYKAMGADGNQIGTVVSTGENGYGGLIQVMVGIDNNGKITGITIVSHSETPGLGAKAKEAKFQDQYKGKSGDIELKKDINAISGATITSKAVTAAVNAATVYEKEINKGGLK